MTERAYPLDNVNYYAEDVQMYHAARNVGVINITGDDLVVKPAGGMNVLVTPGYAFLHTADGKAGGITYGSDAQITKTVSTAGTSVRYDYVAVRFSSSTNKCETVLVKGSNTRPTPVRNATTYEIILAIIKLAANASSITAASIEDTRGNDDLCGFSFEDFKYKVGGLTDRDAILRETPEGWFYFQLED